MLLLLEDLVDKVLLDGFTYSYKLFRLIKLVFKLVHYFSKNYPLFRLWQMNFKKIKEI